MIALDEARFIASALSSAEAVATEIVVGIDSRTTDETEAIAQRHGARTFRFDWQDDFGAARNLTIEEAQSDWILVIDADERLWPAGAEVVCGILDFEGNPLIDLGQKVTGFALEAAELDLQGMLHGIQPSSGRLFRNTPEVRYAGRVHEEPFVLADPKATRWGLLTGGPHLAHLGFDPMVWQEREKEHRNRYLLALRIAEDTGDDYARFRLAQMDARLEVEARRAALPRP